MNIHIGEKIKSVVIEKRISSPQLAKMMGFNPTGFAQLYRREDMRCRQLQKISELLKHDFFQYYVENPSAQADLSGKLAESEKRCLEMQKENEILRKENSYLKQINELLGRKK